MLLLLVLRLALALPYVFAVVVVPPSIDHANWMGDLQPIIANATLFDLTLPGSHDTMTYDLSTYVCDGSDDLPTNLSYLLHAYLGNALGLGEFARNQSMTQGLSITEQLDSGLRFIDFRIMYTLPPSNDTSDPDWYSMHFMESNAKAIVYAQAVRNWLDAHTSEVVVIWFSYHGDTCHTVYPNVPPAAMSAFWSLFENVMGPLLFNGGASGRRVNETTLSALLSSGQRCVAYVSPQSFAAGAPTALDGCSIDNDGDGYDMDALNASFANVLSLFASAATRRAADKATDSLYLLQLGASVPVEHLERSFFITYFPEFASGSQQACVSELKIPNSTFCPLHLMDVGLLVNYYQQSLLDLSITDGYDLPGAIYIDGVDVNGTIRTGPQLFGPFYGGDDVNPSDPHSTARYSYVDTMLYATVRRLCGGSGDPAYGEEVGMLSKAARATCDTFLAALKAQRARFPTQQWTDTATGRSNVWTPVTPLTKHA